MNARITVIKKSFHEAVIAEHLPEYSKRATPCGVFEEGQTFDIAGPFPSRPDGFCDWAWADIHRNVAMACLGARLPSGVEFPCCSDGLRPVTFRIEPIEA